MEDTENVDDVFLELLKTHIDELRSGDLPKGKFIGKYIQEVRSKLEKGKDDHFYKRPQVIGEGNESDNNWLDYIIGMDEEEFMEFREILFDEGETE